MPETAPLLCFLYTGRGGCAQSYLCRSDSPPPRAHSPTLAAPIATSLASSWPPLLLTLALRS